MVIYLVVAYTLLKVVPGKEKEVIAKLQEFDEVAEVMGVYGIYDMILKIETSDVKALDEFIYYKLRVLEGITETLTFIVSSEIYIKKK